MQVNSTIFVFSFEDSCASRTLSNDVTPPPDKGNTPAFAGMGTKEVPDFSKVDTQKEALDRLKSVAKPTWNALQHVVMDDYKGMARALLKAARASGEKLAKTRNTKVLPEPINTNLVPEYLYLE